jgi:type II secretory pathway pseudopilin PulG
MRLSLQRRSNRGEAAFTMVEIAISMAVVAFALVAIVGVLPTGLQVQKDNREETIINADGAYLLEAIRTGTDRLSLLSSNVYFLSLGFKNGSRDTFLNEDAHLDGQRLLGLLATPKSRTEAGVSNVVAWVRALNGTAVDRDPVARDIAFRYQLITEVVPFTALPPDATQQLSAHDLARLNRLQNGLYEVRLTMRWPLYRDSVNAPDNARVGTKRRTFRALVGGSQIFYPTNFVEGEHLVYYFQPSLY